MRQRLIALVVVVAFLVGLGAVVKYGTSGTAVHPAADGDLPKLPAGAAATAERTALAQGGAPMAADAAGSGFARPGFGMDFTVEGELPKLDGTAPAYGFEGRAGDADVTALAAAFGITGTMQSKGDTYSIVSSPAGTVSVERTGVRRWTYFKAPPANAPDFVGDSCSTSSDGSTTCSGSAQSAIGCAVPPCPPNQACTDVARKCVPEPMPRPTDLPTKDEAQKAALAVLAKVGVDTTNAAVRVDDQYLSWMVIVTPRIDGREVAGLLATVGVGSKGAIVGASGVQGRPVKIGDYPLAGTTVGLQRLKEGRFMGYGMYTVASDMGVVESTPVGAPATATTGSATDPAKSPATTTGSAPDRAKSPASTTVAPEPTPMPMPTPTPTVLTGVRIELGLVAAADGTAKIVPAYVFLTRDAGALPPVPAVIDALLEDPVPQPVPLPPQEGTPVPMPMPAPAAKPGAEPQGTTSATAPMDPAGDPGTTTP